jgi:arsenite/tail-anchored protein-transporting ATPase
VTRASEGQPPRVLLFTGKGGVGKTTTAAATAVHLAAAGQRVLATSADPAHSLADSMDVALGSAPTEVRPGCWAQQLDARERLEESWNDIREWMLEVLDWAGVAAIEAEELAVVPGLDELFALTELESLVASGDYDTIVVDCAPTAETIRLLSLPDILSWYMDRLFPASRRLTRVVGPVLHRFTSLPVADDAVFRAGQRFYDQLDAVRRILSDPAVTSARLVVNPERMVIAEARRTYTYLSLFGYQVDAVVVNRVLPDVAADPWFEDWRRSQAAHLDTIGESFAPLPVFHAEHTGGEVVGLDALADLAGQLWSGVDPSCRLVDEQPLRMQREGNDVVLSVELPFTERDEVDLTRNADELFIALGPHRRNLLLPDSLRRREIRSASLVDGRLQIAFSPPPT